MGDPTVMVAVGIFLRRFGAAILILLAILVVGLLATAIAVPFLNADYYAREAETVTLNPGNANTSSAQKIQVRLVLHRLLPEENEVEASIAVEGNRSNLPASLRNVDNCLLLVFGDRLREAGGQMALPVSCQAPTYPGYVTSGFNSETARFALPAYPSVSSYPFDDWKVLPWVKLLATDGSTVDVQYDAVKALSGKRLRISGDKDNWELSLRRPSLEVALVITCGGIFFVLALLIAAKLFSRAVVLSGLQEILAVAGYIVAAAGLRDLLGVSRVGGVSAWEVLVIGVPIAVLAIGVAVSTLRGARQPRR